MRKLPKSRLGIGVLAVACGSLAGVIATAAGAYALLGKEAPDFALRAVAGENVRLSEHRGEVVALSFWSSRCAECSAQLAQLDRSLKTYESAGLRIFGIGIDDDASRSEAFAKAQSVAYPLLLDPGKGVGREYQVDVLPLTVLIDRNGVARYVHRDYSPKSEAAFREELRVLLNE